MLRDYCYDCMIKHCGQAAVLLMETKKGYPEHFIYAIGHLAEAEDEIVQKHPNQAGKIREFRISLLNGEEVDLDEFMFECYKFWRRYHDIPQ